MGRTREFDNEFALDRAGDLFWRQGYDVVSIQQLEGATGLGRGSLYNAFSDKEGLFLASLGRYVATHGSRAMEALNRENVGDGIRGMLDAIVARMADPRNPRGCLLTNTSMTYGSHSPRIDAEVSGLMGAIEARLFEVITRARDEGQIPADADARQLARFYAAVAQSLGVIHKAQGDVAALHDIVAVAMRAWPGRPAPSPSSKAPGG